MNDDTWRFLTALYARCTSPSCITLTAIHPTENRPVPSRHIPLGDAAALHDALERLHAANEMGWGAYYGLATRRRGLTRWQRGDMNALVEVPAIIADIDEPPSVVLPRIRAFPIPPSCIIRSGHGIHLLWLLHEPTTDKQQVNAIHRGLAETLKGDYLTATTALRLPGSVNTKPDRNNALCQVETWETERRYSLADFTAFMAPGQLRMNIHQQQKVRSYGKNRAELVDQITAVLIRDFGGFMKPNGWLSALCPFGHEQDRPGQHFGFLPSAGVGFCFGRHGYLRVSELTALLKFEDDLGNI